MHIIYNAEGNGIVHLDVLKAICGNTESKSMLDICCGFAPQTRQLGFIKRKFVDIVSRDLEEENENFFVSDILKSENIGSGEKWDVCICLDGIEHFNTSDAIDILSRMMQVSYKQIIFTPLGDYLIETVKTNNPDSHKSGWLPNEFEGFNWHTITFPNYHPTLNIGAFFAFHCEDSDNEFNRIVNELNTKSWAK